jgi:hypothetical protein
MKPDSSLVFTTAHYWSVSWASHVNYSYSNKMMEHMVTFLQRKECLNVSDYFIMKLETGMCKSEI